ncbi:MAG: bi-domain-containing oxidoreductase [Planctomycetaceae bacterium]|nr:bi-domain-containing oxidoreductase [Planctomycetaceae bacterium]
MLQILQSLRDGETQLVDIPCPQLRPGALLIRTQRTLISAGTERMLQEFGKAGWIGKARQQPDKVRQVLDKIKTDGLFATLDAVFDKLDEPLPLGYCHVGEVLEVGRGVTGFEPGDRVLSNGPHAEIVCVPQNLCAHIPDGVSDDAAAFGVLGSIALQGIRLLQPTLGECVLVSGLGLIGLLAVQLLKAHGARVIGADFNAARLEQARRYGAETIQLGRDDLEARCAAFSRGRGIDAVLITAATKSDEPVHQAATVCRKRGRIVLTGAVGLHLSRDDFYKKELSFQVSCSYGPGRYDPAYEDRGEDYPAAFVRWTEQRNFEAVLDMLADGRIETESLISHRFGFDQALAAYELIGSPQPSLGVVLNYGDSDAAALRRSTIPFPRAATKLSGGERVKPVVAFIGAGGFANRMLLPAFKKHGAELRWVATRSGVSGVHAARKFGIAHATTDLDEVFDDPSVNTVVIATRHDSHADFVCRALAAGKHVFVEKPLALNRSELDAIREALATASRGSFAPLVMVGFNRRFAPHIQTIAPLLKTVVEPKTFVMTVNAGDIPADHWVHHPEQGGGRIIGEGCHFIDLLRYLCGHPIVQIQATRLGGRVPGVVRDDKLTCTLQFADGSFGTVHYLANGHRSVSKERLEIFAAGRVLQLDNFRRLTGYGWAKFRAQNLWKQDKGHDAEVQAFLTAIRAGQPSPIAWDELAEATCVTCDVVTAAETSQTIRYTPDESGRIDHNTEHRDPPPMKKSA